MLHLCRTPPVSVGIAQLTSSQLDGEIKTFRSALGFFRDKSYTDATEADIVILEKLSYSYS